MKIAILGYGNIGRAAEDAIKAAPHPTLNIHSPLLFHRKFCSGITTAKNCSFSTGSSGIVVAVGIFEVAIISPFALRSITS